MTYKLPFGLKQKPLNKNVVRHHVNKMPYIGWVKICIYAKNIIHNVLNERFILERQKR